MKDRIIRLINQMQCRIYDKDTEIALSLLAAMAGESILLLGPPGVAKSMVARRLKLAFREAKGFEYLMSRFSTPDEIFGPVSISKLKETDSYERCVDGYLPTADVVFLDEMWKAGPAIQNTLLTVMNEKLFRNGSHELHLPLKLLVAASNELPAQGEGLEALWDRFIIRLECRNISNDQLFLQMLTTPDDSDIEINTEDQISNEEYEKWSGEIDGIKISQLVLDAIIAIRKSLRSVRVDADSELRNIYVSDRRWKNIVRLLRTSAFLQDRGEVELEDLVPMYHCLWQEPEERDAVRKVVIQAVFATYANRLAELKSALKEEIKNAKIKRAAGQISERKLQRDSDKRLYYQLYYRVTGKGMDDTFIMASDFQMLPYYITLNKDEGPEKGILYKDKTLHGKNVIRRYYDKSVAPIGSTLVILSRDDDHLYIDGVEYGIEKIPNGERNLFSDMMLSDTTELRDFSKEIDALADALQKTERAIYDNIFVSAADKKEVKDYLAAFYKEMAFTRQDIGKIYD